MWHVENPFLSPSLSIAYFRYTLLVLCVLRFRFIFFCALGRTSQNLAHKIVTIYVDVWAHIRQLIHPHRITRAKDVTHKMLRLIFR